MGNFAWTYIDHKSNKHNVGVIHGEKTGHLMIYCNSRVVAIDFRVKDSKKYTFFINHELVEIELERRGHQMYYHFHIDRKTDTPLNRERNKIERKHLRQSLLFVGMVALLLTAFAGGVAFTAKKYGRNNALQSYDGPKRETFGEVSVRLTSNAEPIVRYQFAKETRVYDGLYENATSVLVLENGLPLQNGDEFKVVYASDNPNLSEIDFSQPSRRQIQVYRQRAVEQHAELHPELADWEVACAVDAAYDVRGLQGYADIYWQQSPPSANARHNQKSYLRLIRDIPWQRAREQRCMGLSN